jgi:hypothetical protein
MASRAGRNRIAEAQPRDQICKEAVLRPGVKMPADSVCDRKGNYRIIRIVWFAHVAHGVSPLVIGPAVAEVN